MGTYEMNEAIKQAENAMNIIKSYRNILKKAQELDYNIDVDHDFILQLKDICLETAYRVGPFLRDKRF